MIYRSHGEDRDDRYLLKKINPAVKLLCLLLLSVSYIVVNSVIGHIFALAFLFILLYMSQLEFTVVTSAINRILPLLLFVIVLNFCFASPGTAFSRWQEITPSFLGGIRGILISIKITEIVVIFDMFNAVTEPMTLVSSLSVLFRPLSLLGIAHEQIALTTALSFRFFDNLRDKFDEIFEIQRNSRLNYSQSGKKPDAAGKLRLLMPVLYESFSDARERAFLLEARGVPAYMRTHAKLPGGISLYDYCAMTVCAAFFAVQLIIL